MFHVLTFFYLSMLHQFSLTDIGSNNGSLFQTSTCKGSTTSIVLIMGIRVKRVELEAFGCFWLLKNNNKKNL